MNPDLEERRAGEPAIDLVDELRSLLGGAHTRVVGIREPQVDLLAPRPVQPGAIKPEADLDQAELHRLEAGRGNQQVAEIEEVERRHRLQDAELLHQELQDLDDAVEAAHDAAEILVLERVAVELRLDAAELVQDLLEPQLVGLVHDDEQHLVVRRLAAPQAFRPLAIEQPVELQVVGVIAVGCLVRHGAACGVATLRRRVGEPQRRRGKSA